MSKISDFRGEYRWLSNFHLVEVHLAGLPYPSTEHAYQAAKTLDATQRCAVRCAKTPGQAKRLGQTLKLRDDWEQVKIAVMLDLQRQKYKQPDLRTKLLATGDAELIEGNTWGDRFWGVCKGEGLNWLGRLLMQVRDEIRAVS